MTLISECRCWQIMQCDPETLCPAKESPGEECWDIMGSHNPCAFNICRDCLVYVVKRKDPSLSPEEVVSILTRKGICFSDPKK
jgi:hypothetical protein